MSIRKITFPDHTADDFDSDQVFEAGNGLKYTWNGRYGWELVDGGIEDYDDQWIKDDQKRQDDEFAKGQAAQDDAFAKGQAAQDDAFAKGQATQDKALQDEIDARAERDLQHDAQIETIEYKLDALLGLQFRGVYEFKHENDCNAAYEACIEACWNNDPTDTACRTQCGKDQVDCEKDKVRPGFFEAVDPDDKFDHLEYIVISKSDKAGVEIDWPAVLDAGDYLEVDHVVQGGLDKRNYGLYRIIEEPETNLNAFGEEVYTMHLEFLQGDGVMNVREDYEIRGISRDEGVNPEELADFLTREDAMKTYLPLIGGTLSGTLNGQLIKSTRATGYAFEAKPNDSSTTAWIKTDGSASFTGSVQVDGDNLATENYVNANVSSGAKGEKGNLGAGTQGEKGARGNTGGSGAKGNRGYSGSKGSPGSDMVMQTGTSTNPSLARGKMYLNYNTKVLYIGL